MTNSDDPLFQPYKLDSLTLPNRVLMSPLTRSRSSQPGDIPNDTNAESNRQGGCRSDYQRGHPGVAARRLNDLDVAFIEVVEDSFQGNLADGRPEDVIDAIQAGFKGTYIANGAYSAEEARKRIRAGRCDLVTFGRLFIANPDLPERFRQNAPLNEWDESTFYGGDEHGYIDYPPLQ